MGKRKGGRPTCWEQKMTPFIPKLPRNNNNKIREDKVSFKKKTERIRLTWWLEWGS